MSFFNELKRRNVFRVGIAYTVATWLLIQVTDTVFPRIGLPDSAVTLVIALLAIGFVPALIFAWAFEMTPDGIKRERDVDRTQSITPNTGKNLNRLIIAGLVLVIVVMGVERTWFAGYDEAEDTQTAVKQQATPQDTNTVAGTDEATDEPSVAVLPFVNMSSDPEQEYFSDGISEEILNVLTRIPGLKVAARTSSFQFKGKNLDIADIGRQLQVNHLLEGSVRKSGNTLRITAQLIETGTGFHLWSETFDRNPEDVFAIQDEIAAAIASELRTLFSGEIGTSSTPVDMQAYEFYLKGRGLVARRKPADLFEGIDVLKRTLKIEPEYAPAMASLAKAYVVLPWFSNQIPAGEAREQARDWAEKALEIDPQNVEALAVLAVVYNELDFNPVGALELLKQAVKLNPGSIVANNFLGDVYFRIGDFENALKYESRAAELDPLGPVHLTDLVSIHLIKGEYDRAISLGNRALALDPTFIHAFQYLGFAYFFLGDTEQLSDIYLRFSAISNVDEGRLGSVLDLLEQARSDPEQIEAAFRQRIQLVNSYEHAAFHIATEAVQLGDFDTAGQMLLQAYAEKDGRWIYPLWIRLPEQAPDSEPWQEFWSQPETAKLAELRRSHGLSPKVPGFGEGASQ